MPTQNIDIVNTAIDKAAIEFSLDAQTWTIAPGVFVASTQQNGVVSDFNGSTLTNAGQIFSGASDAVGFVGRGVLFNGSNGAITNEKNGVITGSATGVEVQGAQDVVSNLGQIEGFSIGVYLGALSVAAKVDNEGNIYGHFIGIRQSSFGDSSITNSGTITGDKVGVQVILVANQFTTSIRNGDTGIIEGATAAITTIVGAISLDNHGTLLGSVDLRGAVANDVVSNHGKIQGDVFLGGGSDVYKGAGTVSGRIDGGDGNDKLAGNGLDNTLHGGVGDDLLIGRRGDDTLFGDVGEDTLNGRGGIDVLSGGLDTDKFVFDATPKRANADRITDFDAFDFIVLDVGVFTSIKGPDFKAKFFHIGKQAKDGNDYFVFDDKKDQLFYDQDGKGKTPQKLVATFDTDVDLTSSDFLLI